MHSRLQQQLQSLLGKPPAQAVDAAYALLAAIAAGRLQAAQLGHLLQQVSDRYIEADNEATLLGRSLELTQSELEVATQRQREDLDGQLAATRALEQAMRSVGSGKSADGEVDLVDLAQRIAQLTLSQESTQRALRASEERFDLAMRGSNDGIFDIDLDRNQIYVSPRWEEMIGYAEGEIGVSPEEWLSRIHPDDVAATRALYDAHLRGQSDHFEAIYRFRHCAGHYLWILARAIAVRRADGRAHRLIGTHTDISATKRAERELERARDDAEAASRAKSEFLASMSHELRTPLHAILGFAQLAALNPRVPDDARRHLAEVERAGRHLLALLDDLIDLSRIESGRFEVRCEAVDVQESLADCVTLVAPLLPAREVRISDDWRRQPAAEVQADPARLRQILVNLLSNAIKYNRRRGEVRIEIERLRQAVRISVTDQGAGIPYDKQQRLFTAFDRLGAERSSIEGGGIGLVISARLAQAMDGRVGFQSRPGHGSTFWVTLPMAELPADAAPPTTAASSEPETVAPRSRQPVVLVIEDNPVNLRLMRQIFARRRDTRLIEAEDAESGLRLAFSELPDLVLMDINLPGRDGYSALEELRGDPKTADIPVVAVTANAMKADQRRGRKSGFNAYLTKPVDVRQLFALLDRVTSGQPLDP